MMAFDQQQIANDAGISIDEVRARYMVLTVARWKADFRLFAKQAINIRTKEGDLAPLVLNDAQEILLRAADAQLEAERWVRLAGLKGRRQGFCVGPKTRVLTADLRWVPISELEIGDEVVACDEQGEGQTRRGFSHRKMRTAIVEAKCSTFQKAYRLHFDDGSSVDCSENHRWLCQSSADTLVWSSISGENRISGYGPKKHQIKVGTVIRAITDKPWENSRLEDAWFGGILDGEGSLHARDGGSVSMSVVQRENSVWWRMLSYVMHEKYETKISVDGRAGFYGNKGKQSSTPINVIEINKLKNIFRCIGVCRPIRFLENRFWEGRKLPSDCARKVIRIEILSSRELIDVQTSTGTFVAEGLVSHNSTMVAARGYWRSTLWDRQNIYILSHEMAASTKLFEMVALMQEKNPFPPKVGTDNAKELEFIKRGSSYTVATAGQKAGGRGGGVSFFHGSEVAWWTNAPDHFSASVQAVDEVRGVWGVLWREPRDPLPFEAGIGKIEGWVKAPSEIWLETTSAGPIGEFYKRYLDAMKKLGRYRAAFVPWTVQQEYVDHGEFTASQEADEEGELSEAEYQDLHNLSDAQMLWRRSKIHELGSEGKFRQEYPIDVVEAFSSVDIDSFIKPALVLRARKRIMDDPDAPLIMGIDPAGAGGDRFAVAFRRGDKILKVIHRTKLEHDDAVAWVSYLIEEYSPARACIDRGSMGGALISSLRNMNKKYFDLIKGVDFGGTSKFKKASPKRAGPWNIRAEIYDKFRTWLVEGGSIPDDDDLATDMVGPKIKYRANNDWLLESKTDMKARGLRSSDLSDACALTFAVQEFFDTWSKPKVARGWGIGDDPMIGHNGAPTFDDDFHDAYSGETGWMT